MPQQIIFREIFFTYKNLLLNNFVHKNNVQDKVKNFKIKRKSRQVNVKQNVA